MGRSRVLSFMSQFSSHRGSRIYTSPESSSGPKQESPDSFSGPSSSAPTYQLHPQSVAVAAAAAAVSSSYTSANANATSSSQPSPDALGSSQQQEQERSPQQQSRLSQFHEQQRQNYGEERGQAQEQAYPNPHPLPLPPPAEKQERPFSEESSKPDLRSSREGDAFASSDNATIGLSPPEQVPVPSHSTQSTPPPPAPAPALQLQQSPQRIKYEDERRDEIIDEDKRPSHRRSIFIQNSSSSHSPSRRQSRPLSMVQTYQPPLMDVNEDTIPELLPIFTFLNGHANKLYQEGYFLKLDDQNTQGRPNPDRNWIECFAQLVGTVLSLWDAAELDAAGEDGEVLPKFINLTDASIQMIESLPTKSGNSSDQPLENILSISTAGRNRYLLHFNSHYSLLQWTAGIRLAMYEQATLQEAYTGALIAGKGKSLNNINLIMERTRHRIETWVRVRFGAGTPWRRCYCVIMPPDEKEYQKMQKEFKKRSPYDRSGPPPLKGEVRFYDTKLSPKKQKKVTPLATITDSYSAYAIYPQAKSLIDASTLIKIEGNITYYLDPPSSKEGFVFVMPEVPPAVSGFEMLLRFLFPTWDTFNLYGRPGRLVASVLDQRSLMFAMPKHKRYGYLEVLDVTSLILTDGSSNWTERDWRKRLKELTSARMATVDDTSSYTAHSRSGSRRSNRLSMGTGGASVPMRPHINFAGEAGSVRSGRSMTVSQAAPRTDSAPPAHRGHGHARNSSDPQGTSAPHNLLGYAADFSPSQSPARGGTPPRDFRNGLASTPEGQSSDEDLLDGASSVQDVQENARDLNTPEPVTAPPAFLHALVRKPVGKPYHSPELRKANTRLSHTTLSQMMTPGAGPVSDATNEARINGARWGSDDSPVSSSGSSDRRAPVVHPLANPVGTMANTSGSHEALSPPLQKEAGRPKSPLTQSTGFPEERPPQAPAQAFTADSRNLDSPPSSRTNSVGSQRQSPPFHQPSTLPIPSSARPVLPGIQTAQLTGKPLSDTATSLQNGANDDTPQSESSMSSFADLVIDPAALDQVHATEPQDQGISRHNTERSDASSNYDDASTASPDYASTTQSDEAAESVERPRAGVLRTVGDLNYEQAASSASNIPDINFGPTYSLTASHSKSTSGSVGQVGLGPSSPAQKTPSPAGDSGHNRQASNDTIRQIPWQAGSVLPGSGAPVRAISPTEFVQQRAAQTPVYQHHRQASGNTLRGDTPTPPLNRTPTYDQLSRPVHSRNNSADLLQRPASRGAGSVLNVGSGLSAREQEQVAKMTGSSLLQVDGRRPESQSAGLVGAIAQREREKHQMKQGLGNQAVHQAAHQRQQAQLQQIYQLQHQQQQAQKQLQQQQQLQQQLQQQQQQFQQQQKQQQLLQQQMYQQPMYGTSNPASPSVYSGLPQQNQPRQAYGAPSTHVAAQVYTQGGGWSRPNLSQGGSRGVSRQAPTPAGQSLQEGRRYSQYQGQTY